MMQIMKPSNNIFEPQRQSMQGIIIIFGDTFQKIIRAAWPFLVVTLFKYQSEKLPYLIGGFVVLLILGGIFAYLNYLKFTFYFDRQKNEFIVNKGVFKKSKIAIPIEKIQQVNINQSLIQKIVNVYSLDIDTAGSATKEVKIRAVSHSLALRLKETLLDSDNEIQVSETNNQTENVANKPFIKLNLIALFKIGLTTNYGRSIAILIGFIGATYNGLRDIIDSLQLNTSDISAKMEQGFALFSTGIILGLILFLILGINLVRTFLKFYNFQMIRNKYSLLITSGLLSKKQTLLRPNKVQITNYSQNFFQKKWHFFDMKIKQASSSEATNKKEETAFEVPGCSESQRDAILKMIFKKLPNPTLKLKSNFRYLIKIFVFFILLPTVLCSISAYGFHSDLKDYIVFFIGYLFFISLYAYFRFKNNRLLIEDDFVMKKSGAWDIQYDIIETHKIQGVVLKQYFWHKKNNLGHITIFTAAGSLNFTFTQFDILKKLTNQWLSRVERSHKTWM
uniref:PH domain-containing protein n=3 Tax=Flavobacterium sp. TaxID=239 RepID=UPI00404ACD64